jgi:multiple sugar transport system substrate-binding protein
MVSEGMRSGAAGRDTARQRGSGLRRQDRTRRGQLALLAGGVAALGMACGPGQTAPAEVKERGPVTLRDQRGSTPGSAVELSDAAIKARYPWLTVVHENTSSSSFDAMAKLVVDAAAGTLPDIIYAQGTQIQYYISQKIVIPMTPYLNRDKAFDVADFPKVALDMYSRAGQAYAIPYDHGPQMLFYNAELFKRHGVAPPDERWTFDTLVEAARKLTIPDQQWGLMDAGPRGSWSLLSYLAPWGASWVDETETRTQIDSAGAVNAMQYWMDLYFKHKVAPVPGTYQAGWGDQNNPWMLGKVGMVLGGPWTVREWRSRNVALDAPIADYPLGPAGKRVSSSMGSGYPITSGSKFKDEAWLYTAEFLGKDLERSMMGQFVQLGTGTPVRFSLMKEYERSRFAPPNARLIAPSEKYSVIGRPISPAKVELDAIWAEEMKPLWAQTSSVKDMLGTVARRMAPVLEKNKAGF